jgi:predicted ABC-type sugar transport system permease subunit
MDVEAGRQGVFVPVALAVNLGQWMMVGGYGLAFGVLVGGLPVTAQLRQKGMCLGSVYLPQYPHP